MRILKALAFLVCCGGPVEAQTNQVSLPAQLLTLRECVYFALSRNLDLQIERVSVDVAGYEYHGAYGVYVPSLSFQIRHDYQSQPEQIDFKKTGNDFAYDLGTDSGGPGLSGHLPYGFSFDFFATAAENAARTDFGFSAAGLYPPSGIRLTNNYFASAGVTVKQHLLKDFWIDSDWERVLLRRGELQRSRYALQFRVMRTVLAVQMAYFDLIAARQDIEVRRQAVALGRKLVDDTRHRIADGYAIQLDLENAESRLQTYLAALADAEETERTRQSTLKNLLSDDFPKWAEVEIVPADTLKAEPENVDRSASLQLAVEKRPDLAEARAALANSNVAVRFRFNQLLPSVDFVGGYGGIGVQADSASAIDDVGHFRHPEYFYGLVASYPLGDIAGKNNYHASQAIRDSAELQLKKAEQEIMVEVVNWSERVKSRYSSVESTHLARTYAEAALAAGMKKLEDGLATTFDVLQLQEVLTAARYAEIKAMVDYNEARAQFAFAEGTTLERQHIQVEAKR